MRFYNADAVLIWPTRMYCGIDEALPRWRGILRPAFRGSFMRGHDRRVIVISLLLTMSRCRSAPARVSRPTGRTPMRGKPWNRQPGAAR